MEISGGLEGGAEPPAFQRAERQRIEQAKALEKVEDSSVVSGKHFIHSFYTTIPVFHPSANFNGSTTEASRVECT